jgi:excisionase family DNA binding protein
VQKQQADAFVAAASNPSGGSNMGEIGIGAMGMAAMQNLQQQQQQQPQSAPPPQAAPPPAQSGGTPDVMTPAQAAEILQVSPEDVVAAIEAGDLKARKIGSAYRISKANLEEFLAG